MSEHPHKALARFALMMGYIAKVGTIGRWQDDVLDLFVCDAQIWWVARTSGTFTWVWNLYSRSHAMRLVLAQCGINADGVANTAQDAKASALDAAQRLLLTIRPVDEPSFVIARDVLALAMVRLDAEMEGRQIP